MTCFVTSFQCTYCFVHWAITNCQKNKRTFNSSDRYKDCQFFSSYQIDFILKNYKIQIKPALSRHVTFHVNVLTTNMSGLWSRRANNNVKSQMIFALKLFNIVQAIFISLQYFSELQNTTGNVIIWIMANTWSCILYKTLRIGFKFISSHKFR